MADEGKRGVEAERDPSFLLAGSSGASCPGPPASCRAGSSPMTYLILSINVYLESMAFGRST